MGSVTRRSLGPKSNLAPASDNLAWEEYSLTKERWQCALTMSPKLSAADKIVALALLAHVNYRRFCETGEFIAFPSQDRLGRLLNRHEVRMRASLRRLVGCIVEIERKGGNLGHEPTHYRFTADWLGAAERALHDRLGLWPGSRRLKSFRGNGNVSPRDNGSVTPRGNGSVRAGVTEAFGKREEEMNDSPIERVRARRRDGTNDDQGKPDRKSRRLALAHFNPDRVMAAWASEHCAAVADPCGQHHVEKFKNWHLKNERYPAEVAAAYRDWLLREQEFAARDQKKTRGPNRMEEAWRDYNEGGNHVH